MQSKNDFTLDLTPATKAESSAKASTFATKSKKEVDFTPDN